ncbi:AMP-dependent synthetase/ligase [Barrientosiimonas endolithica]|uniref:Acyl-CoA synthetase n=1 Tax=Barrientosiimonas endolithica TaxID=1535208 RepID=A0ABM8HFP6_9MICO|nr:long-chain fatty acid--CoA ligase [Barrientosiimonas endolithica]BDZ59829.1 long-chain-fatty-acid--CoA ligase [Barrientosiimonas endolithica]
MSADTSTGAREFAVPLEVELVEEHNLARLAWRRAAQDPDHVSFEIFDGTWQPITATAHRDAVAAAAKGLIALGVEPGDRVAIMAGTSYAWVQLDCGVWAAGGATVPIYPSSSASQVEWIVRDSGARLVVVETPAMAQTVAESGVDVPVLCLDDGAIADLAARGADVDDATLQARLDGVTLDSVASIIYTSGTTGRPKGCVVQQRNLAAEAQGLLSQPIGVAAAPGRRVLMFLPLAHVLARAVTYATSEGGATVGFWGDFGSVADKFASFRPHLILGVPRVFEKVHDGIRAKADESRVKAAIFRRAEKVAADSSRAQESSDTGGPGAGRALRAQHAVFDRLVYGNIRDALGGQCDTVISGGGALGASLAHFFRGVGVPVYEGYGLTESCAAITVNQPTMTRVGSVGRPIAGNAVRISGDGEIQLQGGVVFAEYWRNPDATAAAFDDGWFRTGDLGTLDDGYLRITGRSKDIIVTAGGKNVAPGPMEEELRAHPVVGHAMVVGEGRPFVAALVTLDPDGVRRWAAEHGRDGSTAEELVDDDELRAEVQGAVDRASALVSRAEGIKKFTLLADDFTEEGGELTPTLKVRRHVVEKMYADRIEELYGR